MISALSRAYQVFKREEDYRLARNAANFILDTIMLPNGNLGRVYKNNQVKIEAMLDDYSFLTMGLIDLFETDFDPYWLKKSLEFAKISCDKFGSADGLYSVATDSGSLTLKTLSGADDAILSGISVHCGNLVKLTSLTGNDEFHYEAERILSVYNFRIEQDLWAYAGLINCMYPFYEGYNEFVFISEGSEIPGILTETRQHYVPYRSIVSRNKTREHWNRILLQHFPGIMKLLKGTPPAISAAKSAVSHR
ncbi:MAG: thioredoxin domain-containing protein [Chitinispirillaceae bacterium]|nr:thioredoxin domain-containing protein [Chitinispirillaceae bacterium]